MNTNKSLNNIKLLALHNFFLDLRFYAPIAILYFTSVSGSFALGMAIFSITMLSSALFEIPTGIFSDRVGRRNTIIYGSMATVISVVLYAMGVNYLYLVMGAVFEGLARSFYSGNNDSLLHDSLTENGISNDFADNKGRTDSWSQVAIAIVAIAGAVVAYWSYSYAFWLSTIPALIGLFISFQIVEPKIQKLTSGNIYSHLSRSILNFMMNKKLRLLTISSAIGHAQGEAGYLFRSAFYQSLWPVWAIGIAQAIGCLGASVSFYFSGKIIKKYGLLQTIIYGKIYSISTNIISTIFPTVFSPALMSSNSFTYGASSTASETLNHNEYTNEERATMSSLSSLLGSIAFAIVAYGLGLLADFLNPASGILLLQILAFISLFMTIKLYGKENK